MEGRGGGGGRALLCAQQNFEALGPGRFQLDPAVQVHPAGPSPTCPRRMGSSAKTRSTCLQPRAGCAEPAGGRAGAGGGGCTHLAHKGSAHLGREEAPAGLGAAACATLGNSRGARAPQGPTPGAILAAPRGPRGSEGPLPGCRGAARGGGGCMVAARPGGRPSPGGGGPRAPGGDSPTGRGARAPVVRAPGRGARIALCK